MCAGYILIVYDNELIHSEENALHMKYTFNKQQIARKEYTGMSNGRPHVNMV